MVNGRLAVWFFDKGYGFIARSDKQDDDIFCHISEMERAGVSVPRIGQAFEFMIEVDPRRKRRRAVDLKLLDADATAAAAPAAEDAGSY